MAEKYIEYCGGIKPIVIPRLSGDEENAGDDAQRMD